MARAETSLRQGLDRDVYQVLKKLEETVNDGRPFKTVTQVYDAIKRSNSHLSRQKKRPLEDSIDRVLQFRKEELDDSEDSEAALEEAESQLPKPESDGFLLNRQLTKHWQTKNTPTQDSKEDIRAAKKRRIQDDDDENHNRTSGNEATSSRSQGNGTAKEDGLRGKDERGATPLPKKSQKPSRYQVEHLSEPKMLGGVAELRNELLLEMCAILKEPDNWVRTGWRRPSGLLISGPPGVGKKSLVRSLAAELQVPIISIARCLSDPERIEKSLVEAIDEAIRLGPSIVFIEQLDRYASKPGSSGHGDHNDRVADLIMAQMQRMQQSLPEDVHVLPVATTCNLTDISPLIMSCDFFEHTVQMRAPDGVAREDIFKVITKDTDQAKDIDFAELARLTHGFVGADIKTLVSLAQKRAAIRRTEARKALRVNAPMINGDGDGDAADDAASTAPTVLGETVTMEDYRIAIKDFVPSLRKEGFTVIPNVSWDQVGAMEKIRQQLHMSIIGPIKKPDLYEGWGLKRSAGVMLWGPPGCGKTLVAQAVANEAQASFILINGPELLNKYVGESERAVREVFQRARSSTPCILFFDEMDSLVPRRDGASTDAGVRVVNALLTELDGVQDRSGVYVIGTTNRPDMIDSAMLRPGRLSVRIYVDLPTEDERVEILRTIFHSNHPRASSVELDRLETVARDPRCRDFSGADLGGLHIKAAEEGLRRWLLQQKTVQEIDEEDWQHALANTVRSVLNPESYRRLEMKLGKEN